MKNQKGMTLVELLVTGILSVVIAGVVLTFFYMNTAETRAGVANTSLEKLYDIVSYNIGWRVRSADAVINPNTESYGTHQGQPVDSNAIKVETFDNTGTQTGGYWIKNNNLLYEYDTTKGSYDVFMAGKDSVRLESGSRFTLESGRRAVALNLIFSKTVSGKKYTISSRGDLFRCRNPYLF